MDRKTYKSARADIKSGDLLAWEGRSIFALAIQLWTRSPITHVGIAWVHHGRVFVLEAREHKGVVLSALSRRGNFMHIPTNGTWTDEIEAKALNNMGVPYSWKDILAIMFRRPLTAKGYICSEYAAEILLEMSYDMTYTSPTPGDVVEAVLEQNRSKPVRVIQRDRKIARLR